MKNIITQNENILLSLIKDPCVWLLIVNYLDVNYCC